jgi:hypothetical protein
MAMSAYYLKGIAPPHIQLVQIFKGLPAIPGHGVNRDGDHLHLPPYRVLPAAGHLWPLRGPQMLKLPEVAALDAVVLRDEASGGRTGRRPSSSKPASSGSMRARPKSRRGASSTATGALKKAGEADRAAQEGRPLGPLHGLPVGLKDIIDTRDMPTENGTPIDAGRRPRRDATIVARLRAAGAIIMGKTVTTELAYYTPRDRQSARSVTHARRLLVGLGRGGGGAHGAARRRHPDQRLGDPPRLVLRRGRLQAQLRCHPAHRIAHPVAPPRHHRRICQQHRGRCAPRRRAGRPRPGRSGQSHGGPAAAS